MLIVTIDLWVYFSIFFFFDKKVTNRYMTELEIDQIAEGKSVEDFSQSIFYEFFNLVEKGFGLPYIDDDRIFQYIITHSKFDIKYVNLSAYILRLSDIFSKVDDEGLNTERKYFIDYLFANATPSDEFKASVIELLYESAYKGLIDLFIRIIFISETTWGSSKIDINHRTRYGYPLFWEIIYMYLNSVYKADPPMRCRLILDCLYTLRNHPTFDINNKCGKPYDIFWYLFRQKEGTVISSEVDQSNLKNILDFIFGFPQFNRKRIDNIVEETIFNVIGLYKKRQRYDKVVYLLVTNLELNYNHKESVELDYGKYFMMPLFQYFVYLGFDRTTDLYNKVYIYVLDKYKNKLEFAKLQIASIILANTGVSKEVKSSFIKVQNNIKSEKLRSLKSILDTLDDSSFSLSEEEEELENVDYYADYYGTAGARELSHRFKNNDPEAIEIIAKKLSKFVSSSDNLIPVPSRNGIATNTLDLAYAISDITGSGVYDIIIGKSRESLYAIKKRGDSVSSVDFGYTLKGKIPNNPVLIDGVYDTGTTLRNALRLIPNARIVVFAKTIKKNLN